MSKKFQRNLTLAAAAIVLGAAPSLFAAAFATGNIVVNRVGDGATALSNAAFPVNLLELTTAGALVQTIPMPTTVVAANRRFTLSGSATSEGLVNLSVNGSYVLLAGYDADVATAAVSGTTSAATNRVVARVDAAGTVDTSTALNDFSSASNPRAAASTDGTELWVSGGAGGSRYTTIGSTTSTQLSTTPTNLRHTAIFGGQLYISSGSGTIRVATVGTGIPTTAGQTITNLPGFPTTGSPYGFALFDLDAGVAGLDTLYVADSGGNLQKYSLVGGNWTSNGAIAISGITGLAARKTAATTVEIFVVNPTSVQAVTDTAGYNAANNGTAASIATAGANYAFRGISFTPGTALPVELQSFSAE